MQRQSYLRLSPVAGFVTWLATELDSPTLFQHRYTDRRTSLPWACSSLFNAFERYRWNHPGNARLAYNAGDCTVSNAIALAALRRDLLAGTGNDERCLQAAVEVMAWGGVTARNVDWLKANQRGLASMLHQVKAAIEAGDCQAPALRAPGLRFNSGMTKVYSLICADFLIYDSRVAAALGWLVTKYCVAKGLDRVPDELCFPWAAAKEGATVQMGKRRNPSMGTLQFKRLRSGHHHVQWNMRASWVLSAVLAHPAASASRFNTRVAAPTTSLRALEAALFMIGYDLGEEPPEYSPAFAAHILAVAQEDFVEIDVDEMLAQLDQMIQQARQQK